MENIKPITREERRAAFRKRSLGGYLKLNGVEVVIAYEARVQQLEAALAEIRGWREDGSEFTDYERVMAMAKIADAALNGETE